MSILLQTGYPDRPVMTDYPIHKGPAEDELIKDSDQQDGIIEIDYVEDDISESEKFEAEMGMFG